MLRAPSNPAKDARAVTPTDDVDLDVIDGRFPAGLYIGTAGTLRVVTLNGSTVDFGNAGVGTLPLGVKQVHSTGTGASNIVALYN